MLDVLARQGLAPLAEAVAARYLGAPAEALTVVSASPSASAARPPRHLVLAAEPAHLGEGYALFPTTDAAGPALAVWLEPGSKHGLARMLPDVLPLGAGARYPILRLHPLMPCTPC